MDRLCKVCRKPIDPDRLEVLPDTDVCTIHSTAQKAKGLMEYGHKTAGTLVMLPDDEEQVRLAFRSYRRAR